jgi:hypothetical protein
LSLPIFGVRHQNCELQRTGLTPMKETFQLEFSFQLDESPYIFPFA